MNTFDLTKYLAEGKLLKENVDFPELEDEFEGAMDAMVVEPEVYLQDIIDASAEEIVSDDYYEIMNAVEQGVYSEVEAVKLAKAWAKEKLSNLSEGELHEEDFKNPILDKYLELKKSIDYKTVFPTDLQSFVDSLDNTEREGLKRDLAEGELNENTDAISPEEVRDMAQMVADAFTAEDAEGDRFSTYMVYKVGNVDGMSFELDTEATEQTPEDDAKYGTGEGWGGMFRVKPTDNGYEIRNSEKGGLVATMDGSGFTMLDAEQSKAEMGGDTDYMERRRETDDYMEEGEEEVKEIKSNKMKKSELKEMIKAAMSENARTDAEEEGYLDGMRDEKEDMKEAEDVEVEDDENIDVDIEKDIEVDDESSEVDVDIKASMPGESEDVEEVQALLMKAQEAAESLGDDKLQDQIGNTITYFTRAHVARNVSEMDLDIDGASDAASPEMEAELGLEEAKENLNESVVFPMWNKIK